jgi:hypothetical protein
VKYTEYLYQALAHPTGIEIRVENPIKAAAALRRAKKQSGDAELQTLKVFISPEDPDNYVWILKKDATDAEAE